MLLIGWAIPVAQVATRATWVSPGDDYVPKKRTRRKLEGGELCWTVLCDKTQPFLLPYLSQGCVSADSWSPRDFAALPGQQTFFARPTSEVGDARLGSAGVWRKCHESSRSRAPAGEDNEGSFGRERQGVPIFNRHHR